MPICTLEAALFAESLLPILAAKNRLRKLSLQPVWIGGTIIETGNYFMYILYSHVSIAYKV